MIAAGAAAHSDHGRTSPTPCCPSPEPNGDYSIKDAEKLKTVAEQVYGIKTADKDIRQVALEVAHAALHEFGQQEGYVKMAEMAPAPRVKLWRSWGSCPARWTARWWESMHRTHIGVDADYRTWSKQGLRTALADGWGGSMIGTELSDVIFSLPTLADPGQPGRAQEGLGQRGGARARAHPLGHHRHRLQGRGAHQEVRCKGAKGINLSASAARPTRL